MEPPRHGANQVLSAGTGDWPIAVWVILFTLAVFLGRFARLFWRQRASRRAARLADARLADAAAALQRYAQAHGRRLPNRLEELGMADTQRVMYRPVPTLDLDPRLILVHDGEATHQVIEFPVLRPGRGLVFCSGALRVVTEDAWTKLEAADNALRERLGLQRTRQPTARPPGERASGI